MATVIGRIALQPTVIRPGASVRVEVFDFDDKPFSAPAQVSINGVPGAVQFLQFPTAGQRRLIVRAVVDGKSDQQIALLDVQGEPMTFPSAGHQDDIAILGVTQSQARSPQLQMQRD